MRLPGTRHDPALWQARHTSSYAYASKRLLEGVLDGLPEADVYLRLEAVYNVSGRPFGRRAAGFMIWTRYTTWATSS